MGHTPAPGGDRCADVKKGDCMNGEHCEADLDHACGDERMFEKVENSERAYRRESLRGLTSAAIATTAEPIDVVDVEAR
jgi:hypothetical protein